jgi:hypothetical protein
VDNQLTEPVGEEKNAVKLWVTGHIDSIVDDIKNKNKLLCTVEDGTLKFAAFEVVDGHVSRIKRSKTITPKACAFYKKPELTALVRDLVGNDFPATLKNKEQECIYLSLCVRKAALANSDVIRWASPEIWSFVSKESATVRGKLS